MDQSRRLSGLLAVGGILAILAVGLLLMGGAPTSDEDPNGSPQTSTENGADPPQAASINLYPYGPSPQYNGPKPLRIETAIQITAYGHSPVRYENARLCFYDENGTRLGSSEIGPIVSPESGKFDEYYTINVTVDRRPKYVVVDHPELRNDSRFHLETRFWNEDQGWWSARWGTLDDIQDQFEWPRTDEVGKCG